ncbi:MAG: pilus assembly protein N-terminal domain-containing protein [Deltaproteobacteria bacterium]|nr:pilus assembly protein N-terminal domain-containing protein [Deltaproteobacteria bacterium]
MITALLTTTLLAAGAHPIAAVADVPKNLELDVGAQKVLDVQAIARVAVGDPNIADVKPLGSHQLLIVGKTEGRTTLLVWSSAGKGAMYKLDLRVSKETNEALEKALRDALPAEDFKVTELNGRRVVEGHVLSVEDMDKLKKLVDGEPNVVLLVDLDRTAQSHVINRINAEFARQGLKNAKAELVGSRIFLTGHVEDEGDAQKAQLIAESIYGASVQRMP